MKGIKAHYLSLASSSELCVIQCIKKGMLIGDTVYIVYQDQFVLR